MAKAQGNVEFFYATKGYGMTNGHFLHWSDIRMDGFRVLLPGWKVEFEPGIREGRPHAFGVRPLELTGLTTREGAVQVDIQGGLIDLTVDPLGRVYALNRQPVSPHVEGNGTFRAFYVGDAPIRQWGIYLPAPTAECAFVLLDPEKAPRRVFRKYELATQGSYILRVATDGAVLASVFGRRSQPQKGKRGDAWVVIEHRLKHQYDFSDVSSEAMLNQTPTGRTRNEEFVPGILRGYEWTRRAQAAIEG